MADESFQSDGPDRWHGPNCLDHHAGERTGWHDFLCCCNPCLYKRGAPSEIILNRRHTCCRCIPEIVFLTFTPDGYGDQTCCRSLGAPIFVSKVTDNDTDSTWGTYAATWWDIDFTLTVGWADSYKDSCVWRLVSTVLGIDETVEIDHRTVTCLSVPAFTVSGDGYGGTCSGTYTFSNFDKVKLPFIKRTLADPPDLIHELSEDCGVCHWACHKLWVRGKKRPGDLDWNFDEFVWDSSFVPTDTIKGVWNSTYNYGEQIKLVVDEYTGDCQLKFFLEDETGDNEYFDPITIDTYNKAGCDLSEETGIVDPYGDALHLTISCAYCQYICMHGKRRETGDQYGWNVWIEFTQADITVDLTDPGTDNFIARWNYVPVAGRTEWFALYQDPSTGELSIHWRLESDDGASEYFDPSSISGSCECLPRASAVKDDVGINHETLSITIRCGRCSCWEHYCDTCRCVPKRLCLSGVLRGVFFSDVSAEWDESSFCWISSDGYFTLCLYKDETDGSCKILTTYDNGVYEPIECDPIAAADFCSGIATLISSKVEGYSPHSQTDYTYIFASPYSGAGCPPVPCGLCWNSCGGNPTTLTATFHRSDSEENSGHEVDPACDFDVTLNWFFYVSPDLVLSCGWIGYITGANGEIYTVVLTESGLSAALGFTVPPVYDFVDSGISNGDLRIAIADFDTVECGPVYLHATKLKADETVPPIDPCDRPYYPSYIGLADIEVTITE